MNKEELVTILNILKNDKSDQKGFSFRRTIQALQYAKKAEAAENFRNQLLDATGVNKDERA